MTLANDMYEEEYRTWHGDYGGTLSPETAAEFQRAIGCDLKKLVSKLAYETKMYAAGFGHGYCLSAAEELVVEDHLRSAVMESLEKLFGEAYSILDAAGYDSEPWQSELQLTARK